MADETIVAVGFLSQADLKRLGDTFTRHIPISDDHLFADLLAKLDSVEASPYGRGDANLKTRR